LIQRVKLNHDEPLSTFAFDLSSRPYSEVRANDAAERARGCGPLGGQVVVMLGTVAAVVG
jgi:hypothetical protein